MLTFVEHPAASRALGGANESNINGMLNSYCQFPVLFILTTNIIFSEKWASTRKIAIWYDDGLLILSIARSLSFSRSHFPSVAIGVWVKDFIVLNFFTYRLVVFFLLESRKCRRALFISSMWVYVILTHSLEVSFAHIFRSNIKIFRCVYAPDSVLNGYIFPPIINQLNFFRATKKEEEEEEANNQCVQNV